MSKEYRVWRKPDRANVDARATQGHYILANSKKEAIESVRRKHESPNELDAIVWKEGKSIYDMRLTDDAKCFQKTGKRCKVRKM